jgi:hypothetical protein
MSTTLNYKASNIAKAERASKKNFFAVMQSLSKAPSIDDLLFLVNAGGGTEADFDELFKGGIKNVLMAIFEGINEAGFLGQKIDLTEIQNLMDAEIGKATEASQNTGEAAKE